MTSRSLADSDTPAPGRTRRNRGSEIVRGALINAALVEFAAHGFEGASTRAIAQAADAHQSQIKYHFDNKDELWRRCIEILLDELDAAIAEHRDSDDDGPHALVEGTIRGLVHFASIRPELSRIMMHEASSPSERLTWLVTTHAAPRRKVLTAGWTELVNAGRVAPIDPDLLYHTVIGAASLIYANAPEAAVMGIHPHDPELVARHADALVALFLSPSSRKDSQ